MGGNDIPPRFRAFHSRMPKFYPLLLELFSLDALCSVPIPHSTTSGAHVLLAAEQEQDRDIKEGIGKLCPVLEWLGGKDQEGTS